MAGCLSVRPHKPLFYQNGWIYALSVNQLRMTAWFIDTKNLGDQYHIKWMADSGKFLRNNYVQSFSQC